MGALRLQNLNTTHGRFYFMLVKYLFSDNALNACESSPCTNGATCVDVNTDVFMCVCRGGFFGVTCENSGYSYNMILKSGRLRILASYESKTAKISNFWTFWPVIQLITELSTKNIQKCCICLMHSMYP